jgi:hypothetical protein
MSAAGSHRRRSTPVHVRAAARAVAAGLAITWATVGCSEATDRAGTEATESSAAPAPVLEVTTSEPDTNSNSGSNSGSNSEPVPGGATTPSPAETSETTPAAEAPVGGTVAVTLDDWSIAMPTVLAAGSLTFEVTNDGEFPHRLAIARGTRYEDLPVLDNGAVDTTTLGPDFLGEQLANLATGEAGAIDFELPPGQYVFFCPVVSGPNSHAEAGQVLSVTVS